jgi:hypothetical protein
MLPDSLELRQSAKITGVKVIKMGTEIDFVIDNPDTKIPKKVIIRCGVIENVIYRADISKLDSELLKVWQLCGLDKKQINEIVGFLKS